MTVWWNANLLMDRLLLVWRKLYLELMVSIPRFERVWLARQRRQSTLASHASWEYAVELACGNRYGTGYPREQDPHKIGSSQWS
eukprot:11126113-Ditylum_brightwellii.AAC.2